MLDFGSSLFCFYSLFLGFLVKSAGIKNLGLGMFYIWNGLKYDLITRSRDGTRKPKVLSATRYPVLA